MPYIHDAYDLDENWTFDDRVCGTQRVRREACPRDHAICKVGFEELGVHVLDDGRQVAYWIELQLVLYPRITALQPFLRTGVRQEGHVGRRVDVLTGSTLGFGYVFLSHCTTAGEGRGMST